MQNPGWATLIFTVSTIAPAFAQPSPKQSPRCEQLVGMAIGPGQIGLPTTGAEVTRAVMTRPEGGGPYCRVYGEIHPVDHAAPNIEFEIGLPLNWNSKALMFGGGGFDGSIPPIARQVPNSPEGTTSPLARGYAVFASDSGHQAQTPASSLSVWNQDAAFFENAESYRNYLGDALKKTHDVARAIIRTSYGRLPEKMYFVGASKGGGEAMTVVHRWPADWDGVVAYYPARELTLDMLGFLITARTMSRPGAFLDPAERGVLYRAAIEACDGLDGARDGIISDERGCRRQFDPATATLNGVPLRCPDGRDTGDTCLSDKQIAALARIEAPTRLTFLPGSPSFAGFNILTADLGSSKASPEAPLMAMAGIGVTPPSFPTAEGNAWSVNFSDNFFRFAVARDNAFNHLTVDPTNPGRLTDRLRELYAMDQVDMDLGAFERHGGKLILVQGTEDMLISPRMTEAYYRRLRAIMGGTRLDELLRLYEIPGFGHGLSTVFNARWDALTALEDWAEHGRNPGRDQVVTDTIGVPGRTRPLCPYPTWPKYRGSGDIDDAGSFVCANTE